MAVKSEPYFWVVCDGCGVSSTKGTDYAAWAGENTALIEAEESGWRLGDRTDCPTKRFEGERGQEIVVPGNEGHYCPTCTPPWCLECERPITEQNPRLLDEAGDPDNWQCKGCVGT